MKKETMYNAPVAKIIVLQYEGAIAQSPGGVGGSGEFGGNGDEPEE